MEKYKANCWLINTGWAGGKFGKGKRCPLKYTRAIINAIHSGELAQAEFEKFETFNLQIPKKVTGVPSELLHSRTAWNDDKGFNAELTKLAGMFKEAFTKYEDDVDADVKAAGPE